MEMLKDKYFWIIAALIAVLGVFYYAADIPAISWLSLQEHFEITRRAFERTLLLIPIFIAAVKFGFKGGMICSIISGAIMIPRVIVSPYRSDAAIETVAVFGIGIMFSWLISAREKTRTLQQSIAAELKTVNEELQRDITERKRTEEELRQSHQQSRDLSAHLQSVIETERTNCARQIHDELGQALTALKMDLSWLDKRLPKELESLLEKIKSMLRLTDATIQRVKTISTELRPGLLDDLGLVAAIEWQAGEFLNWTEIKCELSLELKDTLPDKECTTAIFRIFQETLTNIARHAGATRVKVSLREKAGRLVLKVRDNGIGIEKAQITNPKSFGLMGIRERARYLGGEVKISGIRGKGTTVTVSIPLNEEGET